MPVERALGLSLLALSALLAEAHVAGAGEAPEPRAMTLAEATQYARTHRPSVRAALVRVDVVRAGADVARARWAPTIVGTAQLLATTTNNTTGSYVSVAGFDNPRVSATRASSAATASLVPSASTLVGVGARQELFDFGRISAEVSAADLRADAERHALDAARLDVDYDVEEAYFAVHAAHAVLDASEQAYARSAVHRDEARAGVDSGLRRPIELTRAEATLDRYDLGRIRARRGLEVAEFVLAAAVGSPEMRLDISGPAPVSPEPPPLESVLRTAAGRNPDLLATRARVQAQQGETRAIQAESRPNLFATGAISGNAGGATPSSGVSAEAGGLLPVVPNWDIGLVLAWPMFDATVGARADRSRAEEEAVRAEADVEWQRVAASVEQAYVDLETARASVPVLQHARDAAVANYDQANARFEEGMGNAVELADAEQVRTDAEIELALGSFDVARARAALARVTGGGI